MIFILLYLLSVVVSGLGIFAVLMHSVNKRRTITIGDCIKSGLLSLVPIVNLMTLWVWVGTEYDAKIDAFFNRLVVMKAPKE